SAAFRESTRPATGGRVDAARSTPHSVRGRRTPAVGHWRGLSDEARRARIPAGAGRAPDPGGLYDLGRYRRDGGGRRHARVLRADGGELQRAGAGGLRGRLAGGPVHGDGPAVRDKPPGAEG